MLGTLRTDLTRSARRWIVCCLLVTVPLYGLSGSVVSWLGSQHAHHGEIAPGMPERHAGDTTDATDAPDELVDFRRLGSAAQGHSHGHGHDHAGDHHHDDGDGNGDGEAQAKSDTPEPRHHHDAFERHHHAVGDDTVVALDGGHRDGAAPDDGGSTGGAHVLALMAPVDPVPPPLPASRWPAAVPPAVDPWIAGRMERPPKA